MDGFVKGFLACMVVAAMSVALIPDIYNSYTLEQRSVESVSDERIRAIVSEELGSVDGTIERAQFTADTALARAETCVAAADRAESAAKSASSVAGSVKYQVEQLTAATASVQVSVDKTENRLTVVEGQKMNPFWWFVCRASGLLVIVLGILWGGDLVSRLIKRWKLKRK